MTTLSGCDCSGCEGDRAAAAEIARLTERLTERLKAIDLKSEVLARVPAAVEHVNLLRGVWIDNGRLQEDGQLNQALGVLVIAAGWAANGVAALDGQP